MRLFKMSILLLVVLLFSCENDSLLPLTSGTIDTTGPIVVINSPANNDTIYDSINVISNANDSAGIKQIELFIDGTSVFIAESNTLTYSLDTTTLSDGTHSIKSIGYDNYGNKSEVVISVFVNNAITLGVTGPAGGTIFYDKTVFSNGWRYLEAAPLVVVEASKGWGAFGTDEIIGTIVDIGSGQANMGIIVTWLNNNSETDKAAQYCYDLVVTNVTSGIVYYDWFLPSQSELIFMYSELKSNSLGSFSDDFYWSSSEFDDNNSYRINFADGTQSNGVKNVPHNVRAIRSF